MRAITCQVAETGTSMKTATAVVLLVAAMLAGAYGVHGIWEWLSLVSEGRVGEASPRSFLLCLLLLAGVLIVAARIVDWIGDSQPADAN